MVIQAETAWLADAKLTAAASQRLVTLWFPSDPASGVPILNDGTSIVWARPARARRLLAHYLPPNCHIHSDEPSRANVSGLLSWVDSYSRGSTNQKMAAATASKLLTAVDRVDDLLQTLQAISKRSEAANIAALRRRLDPFAMALLEGTNTDEAIEKSGGVSALRAGLLESLGVIATRSLLIY